MKRLFLPFAAVLALVWVGSVFAQNSAGGAFQPGRNYILGGIWTFRGQASPLVFEGTTDDAFEQTFTVTNPTADGTLTFPNVTDQIVGRATTDTLTNKTLTAPVLGGSVTGTYTLAGTPTFTSPTINTPILATESVTAAGATETLTSADCGQTTLLDTAAGSVVTLPAATGTGCVYRFVVTVTNTMNDHSIVVVGNDEFIGGLVSVGTTADNSDAFTAADGGDVDAIQMNGSTEGGLLGTIITVQDISADNWAIWGTVISTDASATMLASGVVM